MKPLNQPGGHDNTVRTNLKKGGAQCPIHKERKILTVDKSLLFFFDQYNLPLHVMEVHNIDMTSHG